MTLAVPHPHVDGSLANPAVVAAVVIWGACLSAAIIEVIRAFTRSVPSGLLRTCFFDASRIPETLNEEVDRYGFASFPEFVRALRSGVTFRGVRRALHDHWVDLASRYESPVLVVWGREDAVLPIHHLAGAKDVFPQAELRVIERCGHLPMIERTDEYLAIQLPFFDRAEQAVARREGRVVAPLTSNG